MYFTKMYFTLEINTFFKFKFKFQATHVPIRDFSFKDRTIDYFCTTGFPTVTFKEGLVFAVLNFKSLISSICQ